MSRQAIAELKTTILAIMILVLLSVVLPFSAQAKKPIFKPNQINKEIASPVVTVPAPPSAQAVTPPAENLKFTDFTTSERQIRAGSTMTVSAIVKNLGMMRSGPFSVKFYVSKNRAGSNSNRLLKTMPGFRLSRNASKTFTNPVTIPDDLRSGTYWLVAKITRSSPQSVKDFNSKRLTVRSANVPGTAPAIAHSASSSDSSQIKPKINSVNPAPVATGQSLTISGDKFGPSQGTVELGFNDPVALVPLTITSWNNRRIVVHVTDSVDSLVPSGNSAVALMVKPRGFEEHGQKVVKAIRLVSGIVPDIRSLSSQTIRPRQMITIKGFHFLDERPGIARFFFLDNQYEGIVRAGDWEDQRVRVILPSLIRGIIGTEGYVEVENHLGRKSRHRITFIPNLETKVFYDSVSLYYKNGGLGEYNKDKPFIFFNYNYRHITPFLNNWVIKTVELEKRGRGTCKLIPDVGPGSTYLPNQIEIHVKKNYETVSCSCRVVAEGPAGTSPH
jgi:hypothetical protein